MLQKIYDSFITLAYPQACRVCEKSVESSRDGVVCNKCWNETLLFSGKETSCFKCQKLLTQTPSKVKIFCHQCDDHSYDQSRSVGIYERALTASVLKLKQYPVVPPRLRELFCEAFNKTPFNDVDYIIPVPLSQKRFRERGYNQATVLAKLLAKATAIPLDEKNLTRIKHSEVLRSGMDRRGRELSVEKAFKVKNKTEIESKNILLIDDVFTSGATVSQCGKALKKAGAKRVYVFTLARAA